MTFEQSSPVPKVPGPPETPPPKTPEIPKTDPVTAVTEETVEEVPDTDWVEEYLPPVSTVTTTASIAVVAAYLSTVGETIGRSFVETNQTNDQESADESQKMIGKKIKVYSLRERRGQQRSRNKGCSRLEGAGIV